MNTRTGRIIGAVVLALTLTFSTLASGQDKDQKDQKGRRNQDQQQPKVQQQTVGPIAQSKDELDAFIAAQNEQTPSKKAELSEAFIAKYPSSDFVAYADTFRVASYSQLGKIKETVEAAEQSIDATVKLGEKIAMKADADSKLTDKEKDAIRKKDKNAVFLDKSSPQFQAFMSQSEQRLLALYQTVVQGYQQLDNAPKAIEWGEKALGFKSDDMTTLMILSNIMAERPPSNEEEKAKQMKHAEDLVDQALAMLPTFLTGADAAKYSAQQKTDMTANLHYTLGLIYLQEKKLGSSEQELTTSLKSKPNDPIAYYRLGLAYAQDLKNDEAMDALGKSVFLKGVSEAPARDLLTQLYLQKNKSQQGLDDYVKTAGAKIGH